MVPASSKDFLDIQANYRVLLMESTETSIILGGIANFNALHKNHFPWLSSLQCEKLKMTRVVLEVLPILLSSGFQ